MVSATLKTADQIKPENWLGWSFMTFNHTWPSPYSLCTHFWLFGLSQTNNLLRIHSRKSNMTEIHNSAGLDEVSLKITALKRAYYTMLRKQSYLAVMFGEGKGEMISLCYSRTFPKGTEIAATWNLIIMHWKKLLHCSSVFWFTPTGKAALYSREDRDLQPHGHRPPHGHPPFWRKEAPQRGWSSTAQLFPFQFSYSQPIAPGKLTGELNSSGDSFSESSVLLRIIGFFTCQESQK